MDLVGTFNQVQFVQSMDVLRQSTMFDGVACNGKLAHWNHNALYLYYDTLSFVDKMGRHSSTWERRNPLLFMWRYPKLQKSMWKTTQTIHSSTWIPVKSAFGGFCAYKIKSILDSDLVYGTKKKGPSWISEHIYFHSQLSLAHDPNLEFLITHNTT